MVQPAVIRKFTLPAFQFRNYRLFFTGQGISLIGTWMTRIATIWLVYHLSHSAFLLGAVGFASQIPSFLLAPIGGVLGDRYNRQRALVLTQGLGMVQSLALAGLTLSGMIQIWHILVLSLVQGCINAFDAPLRQAFVSEMVEDRAALPNAIALNSSLFNGARLVGPAIAGLIITATGAGYCFLIDGLSYIPVIAAFLAMRIKPRATLKSDSISLTSLYRQFWEGFEYTRNHPAIRPILGLVAIVSFMGMPYLALAPIFADEILQGGAPTLGLLMSAAGVGALMAGAYLSLRRQITGLGRLIGIAPAVMGLGLIGFSASRIVWFSTVMMAVVGFSFLLQFASSNTIVQTLVEDDKRGRVMSLYIMSFMGMVPLGNLAAGILASWIGAPMTIAIGGVFCILGATRFRLPQRL
ncbi:MFS transporter [Oscillatoria sp. FACHB-1407]|uniref:MFS transporter n=1 Tax=Oscillatoria sp. FACHB-1407 TaxID=2692847 RepID=UPI00168909E1|nr:MFS transporter [Oscillatoria sp. FACHB-1407]MBD2460493.1 MFS transporter [Oscillatoria sp. FACHB-1407]